jgi:type II secretory ATPase GspE/PulE/Tfp pilus assembly ATPase PilB-like protein
MQLSLDVQFPGAVARILEVNDVYCKADKGGDLGDKDSEDDEGSSESWSDILEITDEPIIRWVNSLLFNAVKERARIFTSSRREGDLVRHRIDGELYDLAARSSCRRSSRA